MAARPDTTPSGVPATIEPCTHRPPRHDPPRDLLLESAVARRLARAMFSGYVAYEIQARCGLIPLTKDEQARRRARARLVARGRDAFKDELRTAASELIGQLACTHCMARGDCTSWGRA